MFSTSEDLAAILNSSSSEPLYSSILSVQLRHKHFEHLLQNHYLWSSREEILLFRGIPEYAVDLGKKVMFSTSEDLAAILNSKSF
jgi:hypothetical protein